VVTNIPDQNDAGLVIVYVITDIFANKIAKTFTGIIQLFLASILNNLELVEGLQRQIPIPLQES
jgi:hypothetical protein